MCAYLAATSSAKNAKHLVIIILILCCYNTVLLPSHSKTKAGVAVSASSPPWLFGQGNVDSTTATATRHVFSELSDDSILARTMAAGRCGKSGSNPYELVAPGADEPLRLSHGTTTVALLFDGGVIAAVDSRASMGSFVGSRTTQKVIPVSDYILGTMAGGAADCTFWLRYLGMQASIFEARNGRRMPVATAARVLGDTLMGQRGRGLSVGTMVMGCDGGQPDAAHLYYVDSDGARVKGRYFSVGSGSTYAYSVLDEGYRPGMSLKEAADLARRAVRHATYRDAFSGGFINVFVVDASGWSKMTTDDSGFMEVREGPHGEEEQAGELAIGRLKQDEGAEAAEVVVGAGNSLLESVDDDIEGGDRQDRGEEDEPGVGGEGGAQ